MRSLRAAPIILALALGCAPAVTTLSPSPTVIATTVRPSTAPSVAPTPVPVTPSPALTARPIPRMRDLAMVDAQRNVGDRVRETLAAMANRDGPALAALAHPTKGVRFSPYPFVRPDTDQVLKAADLAAAFTSSSTRTWGITSGQGAPIVLTYRDYHARYVYSRDFANVKWTSYNHPIGSGNSIDNTADIYPDAILYEAYDTGPDPRLADSQWQSLRLLFERSADRWYLVGIVHGEWTI